jgi:mRNA interferase RelE/StbE
VLHVEMSPEFERNAGLKQKALRDKMEQKIGYLLQNVQHPSLRVKKVRGTEDNNLWEASIDLKHRMTFEYVNDNTIRLHSCDGHEIFDRF